MPDLKRDRSQSEPFPEKDESRTQWDGRVIADASHEQERYSSLAGGRTPVQADGAGASGLQSTWPAQEWIDTPRAGPLELEPEEFTFSRSCDIAYATSKKYQQPKAG